MARTARRLSAALAASLLAATAAGPASPVTSLAGRYSEHFRNGLVDGSEFWSDNVVEVVPVDRQHAYVRAELAFYNGHICSLTGIAQAEGDALVYRGPPEDTFAGSKPCTLTLRRRGTQLTWDDGDGTCKAHCGARGGFHDGRISWASRRAISYLPRLRASTEYRDALAEWRHAGPTR